MATAYAPHALSYPRPGWAEQDPAEWLTALVAALSQLRGREVVALSFGSQLDGLVAAGADGRALRPALIWSDRRASAECAAIGDGERLRALTGCNLDPGHVAAKVAWLRAHGSSSPVEDALDGSTASVPDARQATQEPGRR